MFIILVKHDHFFLSEIILRFSVENMSGSILNAKSPGPGFTKILKLKFMLKLTYKLIFMSLCSNSNFSHYRKFLNLNSPINSDIISLSEFMLKFTFVGIFENSQAEIMLKLN